MRVIFDKDVCSDFEMGIQKEWLEINSMGSYASSTIYGLNTRRAHGLLAVTSQKSLMQRILLLSKIEESVFIENRVYEFASNHYAGGVFPQGYKHLISFALDPFPKFTFEIEKRRFEKIVFLLHDQNTLVVRYVCKNQGPSFKLILKPIIAGRFTDELGHEAPSINTDSYQHGSVVRISPKPDIPELNFHYFKGEYVPAPLWYHNFEYFADTSMGEKKKVPETEDLINPGFFSVSLSAYESFDMFISTDTLKNFDYEALFRQEKEYRNTVYRKFKSFPGFVRDTSRTVQALKLTSKTPPYVFLGNYYRPDMTMRDFLLSLFGFTLVLDDAQIIKKIIAYLKDNLKEGLLPDSYARYTNQPSSSAADCSLILINFCYFLYSLTKEKKYLEDILYDLCKSIIESYQKGTGSNIYMDKDGLLFAGDKHTSATMIPLTNADGSILRYGKTCELNALWYNGLKILEFFSRELNKTRSAKKYAKQAEASKMAFLKKFWNEKEGQFYDFVRGNVHENSFRVSQIFLLSLPFTMLDDEIGRIVLKQIEDELLTPYGLRSLSNKDSRYIGAVNARIDRSHSHYYRGSVWPWTIGLYVDAVIKYRSQRRQIADYLKKTLEKFKSAFYQDGLGYLYEIYEGNYPHRRNGNKTCFLNLTELLRAYYFVRLMGKNR